MPQVEAIRWTGDHLSLIDQRRLPGSIERLDVRDVNAAASAIREMVVRGAPAIGITAAWALVLSARAAEASRGSVEARREAWEADARTLAATRPTAVNLAWAIARMREVVESGGDSIALASEAQRLQSEDLAACLAMGRRGAALLPHRANVYTHCNTGALATGGHGTALGVIRQAWADGCLAHVFAGETRPWLQGARLTTWELQQEGIPVTLCTEGAAASVLRTREVHWVIVGADRIAANGDVANKIGTYGLAVLARHHGVRFMVVAPTSTVDLDLPDGDRIPIEQRAPEEVTHVAGHRVAPEGVRAFNPAFDVTPAELIDALVTERGAILNPRPGDLARHLEGA